MKRILILLSILLVLLIPSFTISQPINPVIKRPFMSSVSIVDNTSQVFGSGIIIEKGCKLYVLTASHVIEYMIAKKKKVHVQVSINYGVIIPVKIIKMDLDLDLVLLSGPKKVKGHTNWAVRLANSSPLIGDTVWMVSSPNGRKNTVTKGILSNVILHQRKGRKKSILLFGTTAEGFFASSGAGVFNNRGELIGIFHMIVSSRFGVLPGANYSVALPQLKEFLK